MRITLELGNIFFQSPKVEKIPVKTRKSVVQNAITKKVLKV